jgi:hypothetical protein
VSRKRGAFERRKQVVHAGNEWLTLAETQRLSHDANCRREGELHRSEDAASRLQMTAHRLEDKKYWRHGGAGEQDDGRVRHVCLVGKASALG